MPQAIPTTLAAEVESLDEADLLPFHELLDADMVDEALKAEKVRFNHCIYTPIVTLCLFLSQVIDPDHSGPGKVSGTVLDGRARPVLASGTRHRRPAASAPPA